MRSKIGLENCWLLVLNSRYVYLVHPDWLHSRCPDPRPLKLGSIVAAFGLFLLILTSFLLVMVPFGWPQVHLPSMAPKQQASDY